MAWLGLDFFKLEHNNAGNARERAHALYLKACQSYGKNIKNCWFTLQVQVFQPIQSYEHRYGIYRFFTYASTSSLMLASMSAVVYFGFQPNARPRSAHAREFEPLYHPFFSLP